MIKLAEVGKLKWQPILLISLFIAVAGFLVLYKLGTLTKGLSSVEYNAMVAAVGWHGIFRDPFFLPIKIVRSVVYVLSPVHKAFLTRLPNAIFGLLCIASFSVLINLWYGRRIAFFTSALFACGAWTLHVSRLASFDVMYLWGMITLILSHVIVDRYGDNFLVWLSNLLIWSFLLTIPGFIWLVALDIFLQRAVIQDAWRDFGKIWQRAVSALCLIITLPITVIGLTRPHQFKTWIGLPSHFPKLATLLKQFVAVPVHIFIRGPENPSLWLGRTPLLGAFCLAMTILGIYFYIQHRQKSRSRVLFFYFIIGWILTALGGAVSFSLLVAIVYIVAASGLAYLLHSWLKTFPFNPIARGIGIGLISLAVLVACIYNIRAYFIAWPNNAATKSTFSYIL